MASRTVGVVISAAAAAAEVTNRLDTFGADSQLSPDRIEAAALISVKTAACRRCYSPVIAESPAKASPSQISASHPPGLLAFKLKLTNCFVIPNGSSYLLVDTGYEYEWDGFVDELAKLHVGVDQISHRSSPTPTTTTQDWRRIFSPRIRRS